MSAKLPGAQRVPRQRPTTSIRNFRRSSVVSNASSADNVTQPQQKPRARKICASCKSEDIIEDDGTQVCASCGTVYDSSNIVSDITFGETSTGQAVVQGAHIGESQRFAQTLGSNAPRGAQGPGSGRDSAVKAGQEEIAKLCDQLHVPGQLGRAQGLYKLASTNQFTQGRNTRAVAAVCLYFCCRNYEQDNRVILMDFSERIKVNVYKLGDTYREFCQKMYLADDAINKNDPQRPKVMNPQVEMEPLIKRYCKRLEFGKDTMKVAEDSCRVMWRWDRDWMVTGRRPSGLCGAAIIIGARMNNYRRSVREIVYTVKASDMTIIKRLEEFKQTTASRLTVQQFKDKGGWAMRNEHEPPSIRQHKERKQKEADKRAKLRAASLAAASVAPESSISRQASSIPEQTATPAPTQEPRRDADGFAIPALPIDPSLMRDTATPGLGDEQGAVDEQGNPLNPKKRKRGRPRKEPLQKMDLKEADIAFERGMTKQVQDILENEKNHPIHAEFLTEAYFDEHRIRAEKKAQEEMERERLAKGKTPVPLPGEIDLDDENIGPHEFDDDPDVMHSLYSTEERAFREMIWLNENEDWLRSQQKKAMDRTLEEARNGGVKKTTKQKKRGRIGDGSLLEQAGPVADAAEATMVMVEKRNPKFSKHVDYARIKQIYGKGPPSSTASSDAGSTIDGHGSRASSVESDASTVVPPAGPDGLLTPKATQRRGTQGQAPTGTTAGDLVEIDDDEDEDEDVEDEDEDVRGALRDIGDSAGALGFGSSPDAEEDEDMRGLEELEDYGEEFE